MTLQVVEQDNIYLSPATPMQQVELATAQADALRSVVDKQELYVMISGRKYLKAEAWQTIAALDGASFETVSCHAIAGDDHEPEAYEAKVNILKRGEIQASGIMICGFDDFPCRGKTGYARDRAAMSAAQTWAGAKAARMKYAWVVTLAGYEPTPADEMISHATAAPVVPAAPPKQVAPKPQRPVRPPPASSPQRMVDLEQARKWPDGTQRYTPSDVLNHIAKFYTEAGPRDLSMEDMDLVIKAMDIGSMISSVPKGEDLGPWEQEALDA